MASSASVFYFGQASRQSAEKYSNSVLDGAERWTVKFVLHVGASIELAEDERQTRRLINKIVSSTLERESRRLNSLDSLAFEIYRNFWFMMTRGNRKFLYEDARPEQVTSEPYANPTVIFNSIENGAEPFEAWRQYVESFVPAIEALPALTNPNQEYAEEKWTLSP